MGMPYARGLELKAAKLATAFGRYPRLAALAGPVRAAPTRSGYRLRAKLCAASDGRLGLFATGSHEVVDTPACMVLAPELAVVAQKLRALLPLELPLAGVDLRACDRGVLVCLIVNGGVDTERALRCRARVLSALPELAGLAFSSRPQGAVQLLGTDLQIAAGSAEEPHHFSSDAPWHYASHGAFTQVHGEQAAALHEQIEGALAARLGGLSGRRVLELYAGSGALGLRLAARGAAVTLVEGFAPAAERIERAAVAQSLSVDARALTAEVFLEAAVGREHFDAVLVNPPRRGLSPAVRSGVARLAPAVLIYVSCEPETLARDLAHLELLGWGSAELAAYDMIPLSEAVECVALLAPRPPPAPRVLFESPTALALEKQPFEPTTPQGEKLSSLLSRARSGLGAPELVPVHRLDMGTSGVCWFARHPGHVAAIAAALACGEKTYVALAQGVTRAKGSIHRPLLEGGKRRAATTRYRRRAVIGGHSLLELSPEHGRKHQLRRHLASIGHAILGDGRYGQAPANRHFEHRHGLDRTFLHCARFSIELEGQRVEVEAELPGDLEAVLASLRPGQVNERRQ